MLACAVCGASFYGRSDALYCSSACRQNAHRVRVADGAAPPASQRRRRTRAQSWVSQADLDTTHRRAQAAVDRARELCGLAAQQLHRAQKQLANRGAVTLAPKSGPCATTVQQVSDG